LGNIVKNPSPPRREGRGEGEILLTKRIFFAKIGWTFIKIYKEKRKWQN